MKKKLKPVRMSRGRTAPAIILLFTSLLQADVTPEAQSVAAPPPREALTLESALRIALQHNPELQAAHNRTDAAAGMALQSGLWENPSLNLNAEEWPVSDGNGINDAKQTIGITQTVPFPGKRGVEQKIGNAGLQQTEIALALRRRKLVRDITRTYYQTLAAEQLVAVASNLVLVAESSAAYARERVIAGAAADQEQLRAEISLEQAQAELEGFHQQQITARQLLAQIIGQTAVADEIPVGKLPETTDLGLLDRAPETWLPEHPELITAETGQKQAELRLKRTRLEPYPDVTVGLAGGRLGDTGQSIIELGLSIPLPLIDTSKGRRQEAAANVRVAEAERLAAEIRLVTEWRSACARFSTAARQVDAYRDRILPKASEALRLVRTGFEEGKFGFIDLLDTQRTAAEVRLAYQNRLLELSLARADLEYFVGPAVAPHTPTSPVSPY
ncbi:MAG: hypothetical protein RI897_681 [Verrucomicrobiota bacterium]|jgi:cobalt-zinc-cadmium efflux system outer membrane protein